MNNDENYIEIRKVGVHDFKQNILGGEILPHDVQITVKFRNGTEKTVVIKWENNVDLYKHHGLSLVRETYESMVE